MDSREVVRSLVNNVLESKYGAAGILAARGQSAAQRLARQQQAQAKRLPPGTNLGKMFGINVQQPTPVGTVGAQQAKQTLAGTGLNKRMVKAGSQYLKTQNPPLQNLQAGAKHKGHPSNKPSWVSKGTKALAKQATSFDSPIGFGVALAASALVPGGGEFVRTAQKVISSFRGSLPHRSRRHRESINEDTSQSGTTGAMLYGYHKGFWTVNSGPNQPTVSVPTHQVYSKDGETIIIGKAGMRGKIVKTKKGPAFHATDDGGPVSSPVGGVPLTVGVNYSSRT
jgi:hypothetical protein